ncbi:aminotransferase class I/II-fold pyridoxal phosphate-dependent enzyme [Allostreptomyces psammosilenae]|uniref:Aspartate/methionine/tyrosine aminotransferase n=1 Tax=Allostreptomyces psammosilenae TaxID=1892865 RepID=A0A852ZZK5_9ACTN|nr:aminotransferase class I/II-fold pyridoxal phosphate-dependent enzyme [Allostreptomyces psammosilenae]NYI07257.1 aspartate/methionine/tyrosine aminotransferase [Allostreptomyces psammosilenae]
MPVDLTELNAEELSARHEEYLKAYADLLNEGLSLDLTRGKPAPEQLDLSTGLLGALGEDDYRSADGTDCRNYGGPRGLAEIRELFAGFLQVPAEQLVAAGNSSLALMHDSLSYAVLDGVAGGPGPWRGTTDAPVAFLCPVPGYDRHFSLCDRFGIEMIPVPLNDDGPDMAVVEELVAADPRIKGMWCVPKYSNPTGATYSPEVVRRLATMETAAPDFRLFWDNAYAVHHLTDETVEIADVLALCAEAGNPDRPFVFGSTSKITLAGAGVAFFGSSPANVEWLLKRMSYRTIGPDKVNQLRHVRFLRDAEGLAAHMRRHRSIVAPKFEAVREVLEETLGGSGVAEWTRPKGGYFISLDVLDDCAARVVRLAKDAGIALTPAGATHPGGRDPRDRNIRLAPTFPTIEEVRGAVRGVATCVLLAATERLLEKVGSR